MDKPPHGTAGAEPFPPVRVWGDTEATALIV